MKMWLYTYSQLQLYCLLRLEKAPEALHVQKYITELGDECE